MSRLRRIADRDRIFFVTTNLARSSAPLTPSECDTMLQVIAHYRDQGAFWLYAYCVMPDHMHLLLAPHNKNLVTAMRSIKSVAASRVCHARRTRGSIWQPRYFDNIIRRAKDFSEKMEYIHNNPVVAGLVATASEWRWSSFAAMTEKGSALIRVDQFDLPADATTVLWPAPWK